MELKSRGEKNSFRHLAPNNLKTMTASLGQQLEVIKVDSKVTTIESNTRKSGTIAPPSFSSLPYTPRTFVKQ